MIFAKTFRYVSLFAVMLLFAGSAAAQSGPCANCSSTSTVATLEGTIETAVQLDIDAETDGDITYNFGTVDGLGVSSNAGYTATADGTGALYARDSAISLKPVFSGFSSEARATIKVYASGTHAELARLGNGSVTSASTISSDSGSPTTVSSNENSGASISRYIGIYVPRTTVAAVLDLTLNFEISVAE